MEFNHDYSEVSWQRCISPKGFNMDPAADGNITPKEFNMFLIMSMSEELGELAGAMKKIIRGFNPREFKKTQRKMNDSIVRHPWSLDEINQARFEEINTTSTARYIQNMWLKDNMSKLASESADLMIYFDLFLTHNNINLNKTIKETFNQVSEDMNCPQFKIP